MKKPKVFFNKQNIKDSSLINKSHLFIEWNIPSGKKKNGLVPSHENTYIF